MFFWNKKQLQTILVNLQAIFSNKHTKGDADIFLIVNDKILPDNCKNSKYFQYLFSINHWKPWLIWIARWAKFKIFDEFDIIINKLLALLNCQVLALLNWSKSFPLKKKLRLNRLQKNSLKTSLTTYLGTKELVGIYHLTIKREYLCCSVPCALH